MKYNIISHITTSCNYDCSYCDVVKDKKQVSLEKREEILNFIEKNQNTINRFKFFGGEPLLALQDMKYIIDHSYQYIGGNYEIVTNATLLNDEVGRYFHKYFSLIFFSIDSENSFDHEGIRKFVMKYDLEKKLYFNLIVTPGEEAEGLEQFNRLYNSGMRGFNILPVYFTKSWTKANLQAFSKTMKYILDLSIMDNELRLYGFSENGGEQTSLANNTIFIDIDGQVYFSDIVSTFSGRKLKKNLKLGNIGSYCLDVSGKYDFNKQKRVIGELEEKIYTQVQGQRELHRIMDYFSKYLNLKNEK